MCDRQSLMAGLVLAFVAGVGSSTGWSQDCPPAGSTAPAVVNNVSTPPMAQHRMRPAQTSYHAEWYASRHAWHDAFINNYPELRAQRYASRHPDSWLRKEVLATKGWFAYIAGNGPVIWERN